jgi:RNA polymerase sigma-70 factor (ECF subfamily)
LHLTGRRAYDDGMVHPTPPPSFDETFDESTLLDGLRQGEADACAAFVRQFAGPMYGAARRLLRNDDDAHDVLQEAFFHAFRGIHQFDGRCQLSTWLHRIVINAALQKLRTLQRRPELSIEEHLPRFGEDEHHQRSPCAFLSSVEEIASRKELRAFVQRRIDELPETYRRVLLLRDIEGMDTEETATLLGITTMLVKTRLHRARQALRAMLEPYFKENGLELP